MDSSELPDEVDECIPLFHRIWERFGDSAFTVQGLQRWLEAADAEGYAHRTWDLEDRLDSLIAYGLLREDDRNRFRVRCEPGESATEWHVRLEPRTEALHRRVHGADRYESAVDAGRDPEQTIRYDGKAYRGVPVDESTEVGALHDALSELLEQFPEEYDGVVLRAPATDAGTVQRLADDLYDVEGATDVPGGHRFEKVNSLVIGEDKDALEYRMFLAPERS